jgi:hypothetical protein
MRRACLWVLMASVGCGPTTRGPALDGSGGTQPASSDANAQVGGRGGRGAEGSAGDRGTLGGTGGAAGIGGDDLGGRGGEAGGTAGGETTSDAAAPADAGRTVEPTCIRDGDPTKAYCDLVVRGEGLHQFEGMLVSVRSGRAPIQRLGSGQTRIIEGKFSLVLPAVQEFDIIYKGTTVVVDASGDGSCGPGDQGSVSGAVSFAVGDGGPPQVCPAYVFLDERSAFRPVTTDCAPSVCSP